MIKNYITNVKGMGSYYIEFKNTIIQEKDGEHGLSHLVEHCMCGQAELLEKKFHENGIFWNAFTSSSAVCFWMSGLVKPIKKYINEFTDKILNYDIPEEIFNREKQIVISEYLMYYNMNNERFMHNWFRKHYNYTNELGVFSDLQNITYEKFMEFKNRVFKYPTNIIFIHPKNISDLTEIQDEKLIFSDKNFDNLNMNKFKNNYTDYPLEYYTTGIDKQRIIMFGIDLECKNLNEYNKVHTISTLFNYYMTHGLSSYLYKEIREKYGCTYSIHPFGHLFQDKKHCYIGFSCETEDKNVDLLYKAINKCMKKLVKKITKAKFNSIYKSFKSSYKIQDSTEYTDYNYFCDKDVKIVINNILNKSISLDEFKEFTNQFANNYKIYNDIDYIPENIIKNTEK